ncbi:unnamed protein product [Protopolystoma xenopodis]|uniref:Uncharacterized protein n=1 Tax=Protopolystoma xenopodis TaxID=117903 RepID=A0A3S5CD62_9PLAT|nr:unnamed protein product [Protopolystoma xenopodis]
MIQVKINCKPPIVHLALSNLPAGLTTPQYNEGNLGKSARAQQPIDLTKLAISSCTSPASDAAGHVSLMSVLPTVLSAQPAKLGSLIPLQLLQGTSDCSRLSRDTLSRRERQSVMLMPIAHARL